MGVPYLPEAAFFFRCVTINNLARVIVTHTISQAATDARVSKDKLADMFERVEMFLQRLEMYTEVPPTTEMMDIFVRIMVEALFVLEIATKEIEQGRLSESFV